MSHFGSIRQVSCTGSGLMRGVGPDVSGGSAPVQALGGSNGLHLEALGSTFVVTCASAHEAAVLEQQWSRLRAGTSAARTGDRDRPSFDPGRSTGPGAAQSVDDPGDRGGRRHPAHAPCRWHRRRRWSRGGPRRTLRHGQDHRLGRISLVTVSATSPTRPSRSGPTATSCRSAGPCRCVRPGGEVQRSPDELGLGVPPADLRIARIVLLDRVPGHTEPPDPDAPFPWSMPCSS